MTTNDQLAEIEARANAATAGPWRWDENFGEKGDTGLALTNDAGAEIVGSYNYHCCSFRDDPSVEDADAEFIAHARQDIPALLATIREQAAKLEAVEDFIGRCDAASSPDEEFYAKGKVSARATADQLRAALTAPETQ